MNVTAFRWRVQIITTNRTAGEQLAILASPFPNDPNSERGTFTENGFTLSPQGWALETIATQAFVDVVAALMEGAPLEDPRLAYIVDRGLTASLWGQAKQIIKATWYEAITPEGEWQENPEALTQWITANGYTIADQ